MNIGELNIKLVIDQSGISGASAQATGHLKTIETQSKQTESAVKNIGTGGKTAMRDFAMGLGLGVVSVAGLAAGTKQLGTVAVKEFLEIDTATNRLKFSLNEDADAFANLSDFADAWSKKTVFDDEQIKEAESFLATQGRTEDQIKNTTLAAMNLGSVIGGDLMTNTMKLDMTYEGQIGRLGKLDGRLKNLSTTELQNGKAVDVLNDKYKNYAEKMGGTYSGQITKFWNKFRQSLGEMVGDLVKFFNKLPQVGTEIERFIAKLSIALGNFAMKMKDFWKDIPIIGGLMGGTSGFIGEKLLKAGKDSMDNVTMRDIREKIQHYKDLINEGLNKNKFSPTGSDLGTTGTGKTKEEKDAFDEMMKDVDTQLGLYKVRQGLEGRSVEDTLELLKNSEALADTEEKRLQLYEKMKDLLVEMSDKMKIQGLDQMEAKTTEGITDELDAKISERKAEEEIAALRKEAAEETMAFEKEKAERIRAEYDAIVDDFGAMIMLAGLLGDKMGDGGKRFMQYVQMGLQLAIKVAQLLGKESSGEGMGFGDVVGLLSSILPFFFLAGGGPTVGGRPYIVGEQGPELFVPGESGTVIPNYMLKYAELARMQTNWYSPLRYMGGDVRGASGGPIIIMLSGEMSEMQWVNGIVKGNAGANVIINKINGGTNL